MPKITVMPHPEICPQGALIDGAATGQSICRVLLEHDIGIEHACELSCACTTCHVIVREGFGSLDQASDNEEDYLDRAWGLTPVSRLACQARVGHADLVIEIPKYSVNHAKENH